MFCDVLALHDSATECVDAATPVPVRVSVVVEVCALLVNVSVAVVAPAAVGRNVIVKFALCPALIVCGRENPLIVKAALFVPAAVTVTLALLAVNVPVAVPLEPTVTLPNARVLGETASCPAGVTPVPETGIVRVGLVAVDVTVRFPFTAPAAVGANLTVNVALCPPFSVTGGLILVTVKTDPVIPT